MSPLDRTVADFFAAFRDGSVDMMTASADSEFECMFTMVNGPRLQLWLLKVLWGALASGVQLVDGHIPYRFRLGVASETLADILWRGAAWPNHWGFYLLNAYPDVPTVINSVRIRFVNHGPEVLGGVLNIGGHRFALGFEQPDVPATFQPGAIALQRDGYGNWKSFAFCWPEVRHVPLNLLSKVLRGGNPFEPPRRGSLVVPDLSRSYRRRSDEFTVLRNLRPGG